MAHVDPPHQEPENINKSPTWFQASGALGNPAGSCVEGSSYVLVLGSMHVLHAQKPLYGSTNEGIYLRLYSDP